MYNVQFESFPYIIGSDHICCIFLQYPIQHFCWFRPDTDAGYRITAASTTNTITTTTANNNIMNISCLL